MWFSVNRTQISTTLILVLFSSFLFPFMCVSAAFFPMLLLLSVFFSRLFVVEITEDAMKVKWYSTYWAKSVDKNSHINTHTTRLRKRRKRPHSHTYINLIFDLVFNIFHLLGKCSNFQCIIHDMTARVRCRSGYFLAYIHIHIKVMRNDGSNGAAAGIYKQHKKHIAIWREEEQKKKTPPHCSFRHCSIFFVTETIYPNACNTLCKCVTFRVLFMNIEHSIGWCSWLV